MLCSFRTGKSGPNWLDRLRSTKGFPAADNLDLDHFLSNPDSPPTPAADASTSLPSQRLPTQPETTADSTPDGDWYGVMTNVLSELFNMGDPNQLPKCPAKKIPRKQTNPRSCSASVSNLRKDDIAPEAASLGSDNNSAEVKEESVDVAAEEENGDKELFGYSRSEVTVIDTSCPEWKFDKLVFRRKNVWKVRDKKGKPRSFLGRKKRKWGNGCKDNLALVNKKVKLSNSEMGLERKVNGEEYLVPSIHAQNPQNEKEKDTCIERADDVSRVPKKRISFSRLPRNSRKGDTSVVLIKGIPTTKKFGMNFPSNCIQNAPKHYET